MDENSQKTSIFQATLAEIVIIVLLILGILATLNYFNILSLSGISPVLSFLPKQELATTSTSTKVITQKNPQGPSPSLLTVKKIIGTTTVTTFTNDSNEYQSKYIDGSTASVSGGLRITLEMDVSNISSGAAGISFRTGGDTPSNGFSLMYYPRNSVWNVRYYDGNTEKLFSLFKQATKDAGGRFITAISPDGRTLTFSVFGRDKVLILPQSIYQDLRAKRMMLYVTTAPRGRVQISDLFYSYK